MMKRPWAGFSTWTLMGKHKINQKKGALRKENSGNWARGVYNNTIICFLPNCSFTVYVFLSYWALCGFVCSGTQRRKIVMLPLTPFILSLIQDVSDCSFCDARDG
jgi:hypothetical protein